MAGFASIIDAVGGVTVDVGPVPLPIGGVLPDGQHVKPSGSVPAGVQHLDGNEALWFARSRRDSDDYNRMGRQRCLSTCSAKEPHRPHLALQRDRRGHHEQRRDKHPARSARLTRVPGRSKPPTLQSIAFDPTLPDPHQPDGLRPQPPRRRYMRHVVQDAFTAPEPAPAPTTTQAPPDHLGAGVPRRHAHPDSRPDGRPVRAGLRLGRRCPRGRSQRRPASHAPCHRFLPSDAGPQTIGLP